jgi:uncharacterized protein (TIGR02145 family)
LKGYVYLRQKYCDISPYSNNNKPMRSPLVILAIICSILPLQGQIEQVLKRREGLVDVLRIDKIDSISFDVEGSQMEIVMKEGGGKAYGLEEILEVVFVEKIPGRVDMLDCEGALVSDTLVEDLLVSEVTLTLGYTGGNGGVFESRSIASTGVMGLTARLAEGLFLEGSGTVVFEMEGTAMDSGNAVFFVELGGQSCGIEVPVRASDYRKGTVYCDPRRATAVVEVLSPLTNKTWMDRNLGASRVATSSTDEQAYGDLYQWGRRADGHQCRNAATTPLLSSGNVPEHGDFILSPFMPGDWQSPQGFNLWQGVDGVNNPCPFGYRLPTESELNKELLSWSSQDAAGAMASPLRLPLAGGRFHINGSVKGAGDYGVYWATTVKGTASRRLGISPNLAGMGTDERAGGRSVRCLKEEFSGQIAALDCEEAQKEGEIIEGLVVTGVAVYVDYFEGNGGFFESQSIASTGVLGLTASLAGGQFNEGVGSVVLEVSGTALGSGLALFLLDLGGQSCEIEVVVEEGAGTYPPGTVHCDPANPTAVVDVLNPATGKTWMDRNLGASQVATSSTDEAAYGDLYQWGRLADGHQCRNSLTTTQLSSSDVPGHGDFILAPNSPFDWRSPQNDNLWQGVDGFNNPCPDGYRLPTDSELNAERLTWSSNNAAGAFASPLKLSLAGYRSNSSGSLDNVGTFGYYWSSTVSSTLSRGLSFSSSGASMYSDLRAYGNSVRCLKN